MDEEDSLVIYRRSLLREPPAISSKPGELEEEDVHTNMDTFQEHNFYGGKGAFKEGKFILNDGTMLNIVVEQRGGDSVEVEGGHSTSQTAAQLGKSVEGNAGTGGGEGSFVYATDNFLLLASGGGGGGAPGGYYGVDDQAGSSGTTTGFITTGT